jgi:hypothetical protein
MKFIFLLEGKTERIGLPAFLQKWLDPKLNQPVGIRTRNMGGCGEFIQDSVSRANKELADPKNGDLIAVIGLLDLYGPQKFYPLHVETVEDRQNWGKHYFEDRVNDPRFRMYFAVHELEAWLLSRPDLFPREISRKFPDKIKHPENVNFDTPPGKLLDSLYYQNVKRHYNKVVDGGNFFERLDPNDVHQKCPYFRAMMDELLQLAHKAGL